MSFLSLVKKEQRRFSLKWVQLAVAAIVLLAVVLFSTFWSTKPDVYAHDFLPAETNFYYEWSNKDAFAQDLNKYDLFDQTVAQGHLAKVASIVGPNFSQVEELVWFTTESGSGDAYLLRFSRLEKKYLVDLATQQPDLFFYVPASGILFIGPDEAMAKTIPSFVVSRWGVNYSREGINVYWQIDKAPEFLESLSNLMLPLASTRDSFVNFTDQSIDFWQPKHASSTHESSLPLTDSKIPQNYDLAMGFNASSTEGFDKFIVSNIILPHFDQLPYYNLSNSEVKEYLFNNSLLFSSGDAWLLVSTQDWQSKAFDLAKNLQLQEIESVLPDGTLYTELVASPEQVSLNHEFSGQSYWQVDNLYGISMLGANYLSNKSEMIEKIISSNSTLLDLWSACGKNDKEIGDFVHLNVNYLTDTALKQYLVDNNITEIDLFSYQNYTVEGLKLCF